MKDIDIIMDWLCISSNRKKLPIMKVSKEVFDFANIHGTVISIPLSNGLDEKFYSIGHGYFRILVTEK